MYDLYFGFNADPFQLSPNHDFAYPHAAYSKARAYMAYAFMRAEGFVMVTGRPGTGKTTLVGALLDHLAGENVSIANLVCTQLQADDLLKMVAFEFGIADDIVSKGDLLRRLTQQLKIWHRDRRRALLIVDEAQDLAVSAMEELRLLTNIQVNGKPLLQIFLLGQPELREMILDPRLEQVHQRIVAATHLRPLEVEELEAYVYHRLRVVGWRGDPDINPNIFAVAFKFSEGIPRRINLIFSRLLLHCAVEERHTIGMADLRAVISELQEENLAAGIAFTEKDFKETKPSRRTKDETRGDTTGDTGVSNSPRVATTPRDESPGPPADEHHMTTGADNEPAEEDPVNAEVRLVATGTASDAPKKKGQLELRGQTAVLQAAKQPQLRVATDNTHERTGRNDKTPVKAGASQDTPAAVSTAVSLASERKKTPKAPLQATGAGEAPSASTAGNPLWPRLLAGGLVLAAVVGVGSIFWGERLIALLS